MNDWNQAARRAAKSGTAASLLSAGVLALCGYIENRSAAGPLNGPSQWFYGRRAAYQRGLSFRNTLTGLLIHQATAAGWAMPHERLFGARKPAETPIQRLRDAAVT